MKRTLLAQAILFAMAMPAMAIQDKVNGDVSNSVEQLDTIDVISSGSMYRMGEVPIHQAKSAVAITEEELNKQDIRKADEIGRYQAGFINQVYGNDTNTNWFRIRGAEASQSVNGLPTFSYGFFTPYIDTFGLEAVEVTKGADSMTFGAAQSGGLINYVTKRAHKENVGQGLFKVNMGNKTQYGIGVDYTGAMNQDQSLRYRTVFSYSGKDGEWDSTKNETLYIAPSVEWDITDHTRLSLLASYQRDHGIPSSNFYPQEGTLKALPNGSYYARDVNFGDPTNDIETNRQYSIGYEFQHNFLNGLEFNSSYRYNENTNYHRGSYIYPSVYSGFSPIAPSDANYTVSRGVVFNDGKSKSHSIDNHVTWNLKRDNISNTLVIGSDYRYQKVDALYTPSGLTSAENLLAYHSGYNQTQDVSSAPRRDIKSRQLGFYVQNQTRFFDQIVLGLGARHDRAKQDEYTSTSSVKKNHTSYSASLMYEGPLGLNPYISYSEAFRLPVGLSSTQRLYDPNITHQYEVGVKYVPTWLDGTISVAAFQAKDKGALVATTDGAGMTTVSSTDLVRRKGIEVQADANLTPNWSATLAYTYLKAYKDTSTGNIRLELIPTHTFALKSAYHFNVLEGLTLGAGIRYVGHSVTSNGSLYSGAQVPSSTVVDVMARQQFNKKFGMQLNIDNVGNRRYLAGCDYYCYYGASRNINVSLDYKF